MPLVDPLPEDHSSELVDLIQFFRGPLGTVPNSVLTMQRRPKIARAFTDLNKAVMENSGRVTAEQKRLIGFIASHAAGCRYCEAHTILAAERFGATPERLSAIWDYHRSSSFSDAEKAAFDFALAAASVPNSVTPEIGAALKKHWTENEIVENSWRDRLIWIPQSMEQFDGNDTRGRWNFGRRTKHGLEGLGGREASQRWHLTMANTRKGVRCRHCGYWIEARIVISSRERGTGREAHSCPSQVRTAAAAGQSRRTRLLALGLRAFVDFTAPRLKERLVESAG